MQGCCMELKWASMSLLERSRMKRRYVPSPSHRRGFMMARHHRPIRYELGLIRLRQTVEYPETPFWEAA